MVLNKHQIHEKCIKANKIKVCLSQDISVIYAIIKMNTIKNNKEGKKYKSTYSFQKVD